MSDDDNVVYPDFQAPKDGDKIPVDRILDAVRLAGLESIVVCGVTGGEKRQFVAWTNLPEFETPVFLLELAKSTILENCTF